MNSAFLLLPDFLLILLGFILMRYTHLKRDLWDGVEKLTYFVLFPALLFHAINQTRFDWGGTSNMLLVAFLTFGSGIFLSFLSHWYAKDRLSWASGFQTAFRFNSYIAFAAAGRLAGEEGVALMALTTGCMVPVANAVAVYALARHSEQHLFKELIKNPLLVATCLGLISNIFEWRLPDYIALGVSRLGSASIALGLMTVGAGLMWLQNKRDGVLIAYWTSVKLLAMPAIALGLGLFFGLPSAQLNNVVLFAAMPTATSAFVLANRMGGDGTIVAIAISVMTVLAAVTNPIWLTVLQSV